MPESKIHYRYAQIDDIQAIATLGAHVFTHSFAHLMPADDLQKYLLSTYSPSNISTELQRPSTTFIAAIQNDSLVAFMQLTQNTSEPCIDHLKSKIQLHRLYVSEKCQGLGIGKELMNRAEEEARKLGIENLWLASWERNLRAERIYERNGFKKVGNMRFILGDEVLRDWVMVKAL